ncbi:MAG TPA: hypothetical protein VGD91_15230 [Trebonia sp.]
MRLTGDPSGERAPGDRRQPVAVLRRAIELGVSHIDTAAFYFSPLRSASELINTALASGPDQRASCRVNEMPGIAAAICGLSAAVSPAAWRGPLASVVTGSAVPGADTRSCLTACGSA